jgi:hypothetical protein
MRANYFAKWKETNTLICRFAFVMLHRFILLILVIPLPLLAQAPAPSAKNLVANGGFEQSATQDNLWDGVDADGFLAGERQALAAVTESGRVADTAMAMSVAAADLNGDGLIDLLTADPAGYFRAYFNSGINTEPKFSHGELLPLFVGTPPSIERQDYYTYRLAPKISLADWTKRGILDLMIGNYAGEVVFIPNTGTASAPEFLQPTSVEAAIIPTARGGRVWGNLFAPASVDWDGDGKVDLLVGEGSYSANAVHLLLNQGTAAQPKFSDEARYYLAYGDGREQLVPTLVDHNGDGKMDLLVGDRKGTVGAYLNSGNWKPGEELKFSSYVTFANKDAFGGTISPAAADMNGDGLFDLVVGKNNGRLALALNKGSKDKPQFAAPVELKGTDVWGRTRFPSGWSLATGQRRGNWYSYIAAVSAQEDPEASPAEGKSVLKAGYFPSPNKVFKFSKLTFPMLDKNKSEQLFDAFPGRGWFTIDTTRTEMATPSDTFIIRQPLKTQLKVGATYAVSFKVKGRNFRDGQWTLAYFGHKQVAPPKIEREERGAARVKYNNIFEDVKESGALSPGAQWAPVAKTFTVRFPKQRELNKEATTHLVLLEFRAALPQFDSALYIDDVQLVEKQ